MNEDWDNSTSGDEEACQKLWEVYVKEAQPYDEALVKSWKDDMDSLLLFSGIYSAILTAFVIESYQQLKPDPAEQSVALLRRISEQLSQPLNGTDITPFPDNTKFAPATSAVLCNFIWFISLAMALSCSILATLVQHWSRRFLHKTSTIRSPVARAHLLQFLYFGIKEFKMHAVVDFIPALLHMALYGFFLGLVVFFYPINQILTWVFAATLVFIQFISFSISVLPVFEPRSPYASPLSPSLWTIWKFTKTLLNSFRQRIRSFLPEEKQIEDNRNRQIPWRDARSSSADDKTIADAIVRRSRQRDYKREPKSIVWTLKSLTDDGELLPFIEALTDVLLKERSVRTGNLYLIEPLITSTDASANIFMRISGLLRNLDHSSRHDGGRDRCQAACIAALYALNLVLLQYHRTLKVSHTLLLPIYKHLRVLKSCKYSNQQNIDSGSVLAVTRLALLRSLEHSLEPLAVASNISFHIFETLQVITEGGWLHTGPSDLLHANRSIKEASSQAFAIYVYDAVHDYPSDFDEIQRLFWEHDAGLSTERIRQVDIPMIVSRISETLVAAQSTSAPTFHLSNILSTVRYYLSEDNFSAIISHLSNPSRRSVLHAMYADGIAHHSFTANTYREIVVYPDPAELVSLPSAQSITEFLHQLIPLPPVDHTDEL